MTQTKQPPEKPGRFNEVTPPQSEAMSLSHRPRSHRAPLELNACQSQLTGPRKSRLPTATPRWRRMSYAVVTKK